MTDNQFAPDHTVAVMDGEEFQAPERGSMLIVALGILALLSILAITFVKLMNLEQRATTNYVDMVKARLIAEGGLERTMAQLKMSISAESYSDPNAAWVYAQGDMSLPLEEASTDLGSPKRASFSGVLGISYANGRDQYKTKVVDTQTQFNLNQRFELVDVGPNEKLDLGYIRWLDALGVAISRINPRARSGSGVRGGAGVNPILNARWPPNDPNAARGGKAIYLFRQSRENEELKSKSELLEVLASEDDYNLVKDYLTTKSWFDPETVSPRAADRLHTKPWSDVIKRERRSPININLASEEVIAANLAGFAGRAIYTWMGNITTQGVDVNSQNWSFAAKQEETGYAIQGVIVYFDPFGYQEGQRPNDPPHIKGALDFASKIKAKIRNSGPFQSFADWEAFVDQTLVDGGASLGLRDSDNGGAFCYPHHTTAKMTDLRGRPLANPSPAVIRGEPRFRHWFQDAIRSMVKANFNPNPRLSSWNPDPAVYLPLDKGGLLWRNPDLTNDADPNKHLRMRQTLEWCLAPKGVFEVISLGEVLGPPPKDVRRQQDLDGDGNPDDEIFAQAKVRGILQLFDTAVIRTQRDFETLGDRYEDGSGDRDEMVSWPVARIYWDPRVFGTNATQQFFNNWVSNDLMPTDDAGHIQLSTRRKVGDIFHTQIVPMGLNAPNVAPEFEVLFQDRRVEVPGSSRITYPDVLQADTANGKENNPNPGQPVIGRATDSNSNLNPWAWPYGDARQGIFPAARPSDVQEAWRWNVLTPDGYLNTALRPSLLWYRASDSFRDPNGGVRETMAAAGGPELDPNRRGNSNIEIKDGANVNSTDPLKQGNVAPTPVGAVEFWWKPDFDWVYRRTQRGVSSPIGGGGSSGATAVDQRFCGLVGTSHVLWNRRGFTHAGATSQGVFSRGTQMYITRNTSGEVRITRLYFEVCGREGSAFEVPYVNDPVNGQKIKLSDYYQKVRTDQQYTWPPQELLLDIPQEFQDIRWARTDYWLPATVFQSWRRGEWHHMAMRWEDRSDLTPVPGQRASLQVWIDGQGPIVPVVHHIGSQQGTPGYPGYVPVGSYDNTGQPVPPPPPAPQQLPLFVRLNAQSYNPSQGEAAERPKDMITVGSVSRDQMRKDDGIFKHTDDGRVNLPANGTIDDIRFYDGSTVISDPTPNIEYNGRYVQQGVWTGEIDLSKYFPADSGTLTLGALNFTAYLPTYYGPTNGPHISKPEGAGTVTVTFDVRDGAGNSKIPPNIRNNWTATFQSNTAAPNSRSGFPLKDDRGANIVVTRGDRLVYTVQMNSAKYDSASGLNNTTGANVHTPALDDISVIYFLPASRVLLKERVNN